jgi:hypothetical protein
MIKKASNGFKYGVLCVYGILESRLVSADRCAGEVTYQLIPGGVTLKSRSTPFSDRMILFSDYQPLSESASFHP